MKPRPTSNSPAQPLEQIRFNVFVAYSIPHQAAELIGTLEELFRHSREPWNVCWDVWRSDFLELAEFRDEVDRAAARSNLLAVCLQAPASLSRGLDRLLQAWASNSVPGTSALAVYSDPDSVRNTEFLATMRSLRNLAGNAGQVFLGNGRLFRVFGDGSPSRITRPPNTGDHCEFWDSWIRAEPVSHWGLNE